MQRALRSKNTFIGNTACVQCKVHMRNSKEYWQLVPYSGKVLVLIHWTEGTEGERKNGPQEVGQGFFHIIYVQNAVHQSTRQSVSFFGYLTNSFLQSTPQNPENIYFHERQDHHFTKPIVSMQLKHSPKVLTEHVTSHPLYDWPWHRRHIGLVRSPLNTLRQSTPQLLEIPHSVSMSFLEEIWCSVCLWTHSLSQCW